MEKDQLASFLQKTTIKRIVKAQHAKFVPNIKFRIAFLLFIIFIAMLFFISYSSFIEGAKKYCTILIPITICIGIVLILLIYRCDNLNWTYIVTEDGKELNIYKYKLELMHSYLIKKGYISAGRSNHTFYLSMIESIKDELKQNDFFNISIQLACVTSIITLLCFVFSDIKSIEIKAFIICLLLNIYSFSLILYIVLFTIKRKHSKNYPLLNSILHDLLIKDSIAYNIRHNRIKKIFFLITVFYCIKKL